MIAAGFVLAVMMISEAPALPPAARAHNNRGLAHIEAGEYAQAVDELELAYAQLPDPLIYRASRGDIVGSMRSALNSLHAATGDRRPLLRLQAILLRHLEALLLALGPDATAEDATAILAALREVSAALPAELPAPVPATPRTPRPSPVVSDPRPAPRPTASGDAEGARRLRRAGGALMGVGFAAVGVMVYGVVVHVDQRDRLAALTAAIVASGEPKSMLELQAGERMYRSARRHEVVAIVGSVVGAAAVAAGVALHVVGKRRTRALARLCVAPALGPGAWGLRFTGAF